MKGKRLLYSLALLLGLSFLLAVLVVKNATVLSSRRNEATPTARSSIKQAASYLYYITPFYFPFKARATDLFAMNPFTQEFGYYNRQNSSGFPTAEYTIAHPPDTFRILILGSALSIGINVPMEETFPLILENLLNQNCRQFRTEVITLSTSGHRLTDQLIKLLVHGESVHPDLIVFQVSLENFDFHRYFFILNLLGSRDVFSAYANKQSQIFSEGSLDWRISFEAVEEIRKWSRANSVPVCFLMIPPIDYRRNGKNFDHYNPQSFAEFPELTWFSKVVRELREYGVPILDMMNPFRNLAGDRYLVVSDGFVDVNPYCHRLIAESLLSFLFQQGLMNCHGFHVQDADPLWPEEKIQRMKAEEKWLEFNTSLEKQLKFFQTLRGLYPRDPWIISQLANAYWVLGRDKEAFRIYNSLADLIPGYVAPWFHMATCSGDTLQSEQLLEKMLQVLPDHTGAMQSLADIYLDRGEPVRACELLARLKEAPTYQEQYDRSKRLYEENHCASLLKGSYQPLTADAIRK